MIPLYIINPVYKFLSHRNLKIFYQLLLNPDIINEDTFEINSSPRIEFEKKIEKLIQSGFKLKPSYEYETNNNTVFIIKNSDGDIDYENEAEYLAELIESLFIENTYIYSVNKINLSEKLLFFR